MNRCTRLPVWLRPLRLLLFFVAGPLCAIEVSIADQALVLPPPAGFVEGSAVSAQARAFAEQLTPKTNRLLAFFVTREDATRLTEGQAATWHRYMLVQAEIQSETLRINPDDFFELRALLTSQQKTLMATVQQDAESLLDSLANDIGAEIDIGRSVPLGVFSEDQSHISIAGLTRYQVVNQEPATTYLVAHAANVLHPANKIVFAYVYSGYEGRSDLAWVEDTSVAWSQAILAANAKSTSFGVIDWVRTGNRALWGAIVGAAMAIVFLLLRRRRA